ncbi:alpha/beta hydrolase family protein [Muricoccus vinaceus]|uniref:Alpha/beta hydrolase family protein n=1 Tax=Muricoccus vinaceus TaxID=424704 RepID=A0ABV6IZA2_9PROT
MALAALLVGCAGGAALDPEVLPVPVREADGTIRHIPARLCRPPGTGPARLVVVNHGSPGEGRAARSRYRLLPCGSAVARHFLARGQAVLAPLRRGYGEDAGAWAEDFGSCGAPDYARAGRETARDIRAALEAVRGLPGLAPDGIAVVGQSAGGWGVLALAADPPPGVSALVAVAPGRGGHMRGEANRNCNPGRLAEDAGRLALRPQTDARPALPVLWLHTPNDSYFAPALVRAMHAAHAGAGGRASLVELPAFGKDGHDLFYAPAGAASWGAPVDGWIDAHP